MLTDVAPAVGFLAWSGPSEELHVKKKVMSNEQLEGIISGIEKQLTKPLKGLGKLYLPKKGSFLDRTISVETRSGASVRVHVNAEYSRGVHAHSLGTYSVCVREVRGARSKIKHRARDFTGLPSKLTDQQVETIVACIKKHLAASEEVRLQADELDAERVSAEQKEAKQHARLKAVGKTYGIKSSDYGMMIGDKFTARCQGDSFNVTLSYLSEAELREFLDHWTKRKVKA